MVSDYLVREERPSHCGGCGDRFIKKSVPEYCPNCQKYLHKYKCYNNKYYHQVCLADKGKVGTPSSKSTFIQSSESSIPPINEKQATQEICLPSEPRNMSSLLPVIMPVVPTVELDIYPSSQTFIPSTGILYTSAEGTSSSPLPSKGGQGVVKNSMTPIFAMSTINQQLQTCYSLPNLQQYGSLSGIMSTISNPSSLIRPLFSSQSGSHTLNPMAPEFESSSEPLGTIRETGTKRKTKKNNSNAPEQTELELNKYAFNTAKARICEQETEINDLKLRNDILEQRLAIIEKKYKTELGHGILNGSCSSHFNRCQATHCCSHSKDTSACSTASHTRGSSDESFQNRLIEKLELLISQMTVYLKKSDSLISTIAELEPKAFAEGSDGVANSADNDQNRTQNTSIVSYDLDSPLNSDLPTTQLP